ncbi:deaminase [Gordonia iterans]|uniref:Deaminase n=1 Tax=Gordonia iterans TaxID=1004901 RepID=A0A2S0KCR2_9ACTN|nr:dihydrofolate reductase family protein [Gordonia iterans]AVL99472.1 deaminase [Gordonia iterans]
MRNLVYYIGATIDGYIAGPGGAVDFIPVTADLVDWIRSALPETIPTHLRGHLGFDDVPAERFDTVVMGRATFEPSLSVPTTRPYAHLRQYVVSTTLQLDDPEVTVVAEDPVELIRALKSEESDRDIWLCGGGALAGTVAEEIDELILKTYPLIAGSGIPLFSGPFEPRSFTCVAHQNLSGGTQISRYIRQR